MKTLLSVILALMISTPLLADPEVGLFYDINYDGEGVIMLKRDNMIQFNFFTYIKRCNHRSFEGEGLIVDKGYNWCRKQQRRGGSPRRHTSRLLRRRRSCHSR